MDSNRPSAVVVVCATIIVVSFVGALSLILITVDQSTLPEGWLALFLAAIPGLVTAMANLARTESVKRQVDDLANGGMDAKIRAGVADAVRDEYLDPDQARQLAVDRARRDELGRPR